MPYYQSFDSWLRENAIRDGEAWEARVDAEIAEKKLYYPGWGMKGNDIWLRDWAPEHGFVLQQFNIKWQEYQDYRVDVAKSLASARRLSESRFLTCVQYSLILFSREYLSSRKVTGVPDGTYPEVIYKDGLFIMGDEKNCDIIVQGERGAYNREMVIVWPGNGVRIMPGTPRR